MMLLMTSVSQLLNTSHLKETHQNLGRNIREDCNQQCLNMNRTEEFGGNEQ